MSKKKYFVPPRQIDEYRLIEKIGEGAMGQVWLARDTLLERAVAIKFILEAPNSHTRDRLVKEAQAAARIHHPNVVATYRIGFLNEDPYIVSEFIVGKELRKFQKPVSWTVALQYGVGLASGLAAAHARGVLHRDVKPANILITHDGIARLVDFGVAKLDSVADPKVTLRENSFEEVFQSSLLPAPPQANEAQLSASRSDPRSAQLDRDPSTLGTAESSESFSSRDAAVTTASGEAAPSVDGRSPQVEPGRHRSLTAPGARVGTLRYMAPEVWRLAMASAESDVYSLGVVLYELCAGHTPFESLNLVELESAMEEADAAPLLSRAPGVDLRFAAIVDRCLRRKPRERYPTAEALRQALEAIGDPQRQTMPIPYGNPYRGLASFEESHRAVFFGRSTEVGDVVNRLRAESLLLIAGDSGVGKSSLCQAGVLPAVADGRLRDGRVWTTLKMVPGVQPLMALVDLLSQLLSMASGDLFTSLDRDPAAFGTILRRHTEHQRGVLIFIDQIEELVTQSGVQKRDRVIEILRLASGRLPGVKILLAVRGDLLTRVLALLDLAAEPGARPPYILSPMGRESLQSVIIEPAHTKSVSFESPMMINELVNDALKFEGSLPLLEFALTQLWEQRDRERRIIPTETLPAIGGVAGALAKYANEVMNLLPENQRGVARRLLLMLVTLDGVRARRREDELVPTQPSDSPERKVLDHLVRSRLLIARQGSSDRDSTYELIHEALLTHWDTLREWRDTNLQWRQTYHRIVAATSDWERAEHDPDRLWGNRQLNEVSHVGISDSELGPHERRFLGNSRTRVLRRRRKDRVILGGGLLLLAAIPILLFLVRDLRESRDADAARVLSQQARMPGRQIYALAAIVQRIHEYRRKGQEPPPRWVEALTESLKVNAPLVPPLLHEGPVYSVGFSSDGSRLVTASADRTAAVWDTKTGKRLLTLSGHQDAVVRALFGPGDRWIATASKDGLAAIWDAQTGRVQHWLRAHTKPLRTIEISRDGRHLATASEDNTAILWDQTTGKVRHVLVGHKSSVLKVAFSPDGSHLATASEDGTARVWQTDEGHLLHTLSGHQKTVHGVIFSLDGTAIATMSDDRTVRLWDGRTGSLTGVLAEHQNAVRSIAFSPNGTRIVTASTDLKIRIWDTKTLKILNTLAEHGDPVSLVSYSRDGRYILSCGEDLRTVLWDGRTFQRLSVFIGHNEDVLDAAFSPTGEKLATASHDSTVMLWGTDRSLAWATLRGHTGWVIDATFAPDGRQVLTPSGDGSAGLWDATTGKLRLMLKGHQNPVRDAAFSPDGSQVVSSDVGGLVIVSDVTTGNLLGSIDPLRKGIWITRWSPDSSRILTAGKESSAYVFLARALQSRPVELKGHDGLIEDAEFDSNGERIITASADGTARIWDAKSGIVQLTLPHPKEVRFAIFSPDRRLVATACKDDIARIWNAQSGRLLWKLASHTRVLNTVAFSPDSRRLVTAGGDSLAIVWDATSGRIVHSLEGHQEDVLSAQFSGDGSRIVTASDDGTVRLWHASSGRLMAVLDGHRASVFSANFSPDGQQIVTASNDETASIYPGSVDGFLEIACRRLQAWPEDLRGGCQP